MFKRIQRIGSTPCKFQYALVLKDLELSLPLDGMEIHTIWTRGPHRAKSIVAQPQGQGRYVWSFDEQKRQPMMLNCTLYRKEKPDGKGGLFQPKTCKITIKHSTDNGQKTRTIGEVSIDLAEYAEENKPPQSQDFNKIKVEGTKNIDATLSFTLHSRTLSGGPQQNMETMSQVEGMDQSQVDMDSVADFNDFKETNDKKKRTKGGLDSDSDGFSDSDDDLEAPGDFGGFGAKKDTTAKKSAPSSDSDSDDDLGGFGTGPKKENKKDTKTTTSSSPTSDDRLQKLKDKYKDDDHSPEVSRNTRPSKLGQNRDIFAYKQGQREQEQNERLKQLEKQMIISQSKREELEEMVMRLQNELKQTKEQLKSTQQELDLHDKSTNEIVNQIGVEWNAKVEELRIENKSLTVRVDTLKSEHEQQLKEVQQTLVDEHEKRVAINQNELIQLKREIDQLRGRHISFNEVNDAMKAMYPKGKVPDDLKNVQRQVKYFERQLMEADLTIDCVRSTYQATNSLLMAELKSLEEMKQQLRASLSQAQHQNKELNSKNILLEQQCKKQSESKMKMSEILNQMEVMISEKDERISSLQTECDDLNFSNMKLQKQLHRLRDLE